ncbi:MAG TPA: DNA gyrase modulator, partial [Gammaproteobacteria bacterium]|nr:DNA gyrase modulator [Gammaproteobacteria bacterium]
MTAATPLALAEEVLLQNSGLSDQSVTRVLHQLLGRSIDAADLYFQAVRHESWVLEDGLVKNASFHSDRGVGVRVLSGEKTGFAYSDEIILPALQQAAGAARSITKTEEGVPIQVWHKRALTQSLYPTDDPLMSLSQAQ